MTTIQTVAAVHGAEDLETIKKKASRSRSRKKAEKRVRRVTRSSKKGGAAK
jgi:hypothetical protein